MKDIRIKCMWSCGEFTEGREYVLTENGIGTDDDCNLKVFLTEDGEDLFEKWMNWLTEKEQSQFIRLTAPNYVGKKVKVFNHTGRYTTYVGFFKIHKLEYLVQAYLNEGERSTMIEKDGIYDVLHQLPHGATNDCEVLVVTDGKNVGLVTNKSCYVELYDEQAQLEAKRAEIATLNSEIDNLEDEKWEIQKKINGLLAKLEEI